MSQPIGKHRKIDPIIAPCEPSVFDIHGHEHAAHSPSATQTRGLTHESNGILRWKSERGALPRKENLPALPTLFAALHDLNLSLLLLRRPGFSTKKFDASRPSVKIQLTASSSAQ